jgi:hypothetical protein
VEPLDEPTKVWVGARRDRLIDLPRPAEAGAVVGGVIDPDGIDGDGVAPQPLQVVFDPLPAADQGLPDA